MPFLPPNQQCQSTEGKNSIKALKGKALKVSKYQKGKTNLDFTEAKDSEWQWQVCISLQTDNHASTPPL